jgi:hypothetical protein
MHYEKTRKLLKSIRRPEDVHLDKGLFGSLHFVSYRVELGSCIYFARVVTSPPLVIVYALSDAPLDYSAIRKLILDGKADLLIQMGLPSFPTCPSGLIH